MLCCFYAGNTICYGQLNWGLPKELATFTTTTNPDSSTSVSISTPSGDPIASFRLVSMIGGESSFWTYVYKALPNWFKTVAQYSLNGCEPPQLLKFGLRFSAEKAVLVAARDVVLNHTMLTGSDENPLWLIAPVGLRLSNAELVLSAPVGIEGVPVYVKPPFEQKGCTAAVEACANLECPKECGVSSVCPAVERPQVQ